MALMQVDDPVQRVPPNSFALWVLGFRPFYLLASLFAALAIPLWVLVFSGVIALPMQAVWWHAHEMLYGFAAAVIVGFLFTAGRNWTGMPTPTGAALASFALVWLVGRLAMALDSGVWGAIIDLAFLPMATSAIARVLWLSKSRKQYFIVVILALLMLGNAAFHLGRLGFLLLDPLAALHFALAVVITLETVIAGRVVPSFTAAVIRNVTQWQYSWLNIAAVTVTAIALLSWALLPDTHWNFVLLLLAALLQFVRLAGWNSWATRRIPMLWILHVSYLWIPIGLALLAAAEWDWLPRSAGIHALTIGATAGLILGMMSRTALGHTGRAPMAGRTETIAFALIQISATARVFTIVFVPVVVIAGIRIAATAWTAAFALYLWRYTPFLMRSRVDQLPS